MMYRTEVLRANGGVPGWLAVCGDIAMFIPLLLRGQAGFVGEACGLYCVHGESQTSAMETNVRLKDIPQAARSHRSIVPSCRPQEAPRARPCVCDFGAPRARHHRNAAAAWGDAGGGAAI